MTNPLSFFSRSSRLRCPRFLAHILWGLAIVVAVGATFGGLYLPVASPTAADKQSVVSAATPLLEAIRTYEEKNASPPRSLSDLVPRYLPRLPTPPTDLCIGDYLYAAEEKQWRIAACFRGRANRVLTYSSRLDYPSGKKAAPVERVGEWAYFESDPY